MPTQSDQEKGGGFGVKRDFITSFLQAKQQYPDVVTDENIVMYILTNISAGADPTSTVQKAIIYHPVCNSAALDRLSTELDAAALPFPPSHKSSHDSTRLPYLEAVIKEGLRTHPSVGRA